MDPKAAKLYASLYQIQNGLMHSRDGTESNQEVLEPIFDSEEQISSRREFRAELVSDRSRPRVREERKDSNEEDEASD